MDLEKAKTIKYMIEKECQRQDLSEICEYWDVTVDEFNEFLEGAINYFDMQNS